MDLVELARQVAEDAHHGQLDKLGEPYIGHPARVAAAVERAGCDAHTQAAAWLHDVVEDLALTPEDLRALGFPDEVVVAVDALSKRDGEQLAHYIARVNAVPLAVVVKRFDLADNSDPARLAQLPEAKRRQLEEKYAASRAMLADPPG